MEEKTDSLKGNKKNRLEENINRLEEKYNCFHRKNETGGAKEKIKRLGKIKWWKEKIKCGPVWPPPALAVSKPT